VPIADWLTSDRRGCSLQPPLIQDLKEADHILGDLSRIFATQITPEARRPDLERWANQIVYQ
jgi:hypothetical protein